MNDLLKRHGLTEIDMEIARTAAPPSEWYTAQKHMRRVLEAVARELATVARENMRGDLDDARALLAAVLSP